MPAQAGRKSKSARLRKEAGAFLYIIAKYGGNAFYCYFYY